MAGSLEINVYAPLGCYNLVCINKTSIGPQGYVILMQGNDRMRRESSISIYAKLVSSEV